VQVSRVALSQIFSSILACPRGFVPDQGNSAGTIGGILERKERCEDGDWMGRKYIVLLLACILMACAWGFEF
jgi:hypothetical protein